MIYEIGIFVMGFAWGAVIVSLGFVIGLKLIFKKEKQHKLQMRDYDLDAIECKEHHLPGDCPLCGAG